MSSNVLDLAAFRARRQPAPLHEVGDCRCARCGANDVTARPVGDAGPTIACPACGNPNATFEAHGAVPPSYVPMLYPARQR